MPRNCDVCASSARWFCAQDDAFLCDSCNVSIHSANVLASRHKVAAIGHSAPAVKTEADAQSQASASPSAPQQDASLPESEGVVPQAPAAAPAGTSADHASAWGRDGDLFDCGFGWLEKMEDIADDFDFSALDEAALVPTLGSFLDAGELSGFPSSSSVPNGVDGHQPASKRIKLDADAAQGLDWLVPNMPNPFMSEPVVHEQQQQQHQLPYHFQQPIFQMPAPVVKVSTEQARINRADRMATYREKRKNLKFEKTIRYATRKAYAEVRPRIKGRFATREEVLAIKAGTLLLEDDAVVPCM